MLDARCKLLYVNNKMLSELGVEEVQILNKHFSDFHSPEENQVVSIQLR